MNQYSKISDNQLLNAETETGNSDKKKIGIHQEKIKIKYEMIIGFILILILEAVEITVAFTVIPPTKKNARYVLVFLLSPLILFFCLFPIGLTLNFNYTKNLLTVYKYPIFGCNYGCTKQEFVLSNVKDIKIEKVFVPYKKFFTFVIVENNGNENRLMAGQDIKGAFTCSKEFDPRLDELENKLKKLLV